MKLNEISQTLHEIAEGIDNVSSVTGSASNLAGSLAENIRYSRTGQYKNDLEQSMRIGEKSRKLLIFSLILWFSLFLATAILCITGNDIILRLLHL